MPGFGDPRLGPPSLWAAAFVVPSGRGPFGEQVAHRARLAAEEVAEQRVDAGEASFAGGQEGPEQEPRHGLRGAVRHQPGHPRVVVYDDAAGTGVVFTLIDQAEDERDDTLADTAWESVCAAILTDPTAPIAGSAAAAVTLRAALPDLTALTAAERALLGDWLDRIAE